MTLILAAIGSSSLINLLIWLLVLAIVIYVVYLILGMLPLPGNVKTIATLVLGLIFLLILLNHLGLF